MFGSPQSQDDVAKLSPQAGILYAILALQNGLLKRDHLLEAVEAWVRDKRKSLVDILVSKQMLDDDKRKLMDALFAHYMAIHNGDVEASLAGLSSLGSVRQDLAAVADQDVANSLAAMGAAVLDMSGPATMPLTSSLEGDGIVTRTRLRILRPHAKGGLGQVSVALDEELHREVAFKEIQSTAADHGDSRGRFVREAEITGRLEHPGIVPVYGLGKYADGRPFYSMRFVKGDNLGRSIDAFHANRTTGKADYASVEFFRLIDRLIDVAQAVSYAHSRGVLHRDLKPGNIMVGSFGETLVIDWGLAKAAESPGDLESEAEPMGSGRLHVRSGSQVDATRQGMAIGTLGYASPEQLSGDLKQIGAGSDVYSLGAILYVILTGQTSVPLKGRDGERRELGEIIQDVAKGNIRNPRLVVRQVPKPLAAVCLKALSVNPKHRYPSVNEFLAELDRWKADQSVLAQRETIADRIQRLARKYKTAALALVATLLIVAIGASVAAVLVNTARKEAKTLAERNQAVVDTFVAAFRSPDPANEGVTHTMTAKNVLEAALKEIETNDDLSNDPLTKATLLDAIYSTFYALGAYDQAVAAAETSHNMRKAVLGPEHPDTLTTMDNVGQAYQAVGRLEEALTLLQEALRLRKKRLGAKHPDTLTSMNNLAVAYTAAGNLAEAIHLLEEEFRQSKERLGAEHAETLVSMNNLAATYKSAGRLADALRLFEETVPLMKARLGAEHPNTLNCMNNLARAYQAAGRLEDAMDLFEDILRLSKERLGPLHPNTLIGMSNLALAYQAAGRLEDALTLDEVTLRLSKEQRGLEHPETLIIMNNLALDYQYAGRLADALPLFEETRRRMTEKLGPEHLQTLNCMNNLAGALQEMGQLTDAILLYDETRRLRKKRLGPEHPETFITTSDLCMVLLEAKQFEAASRLLQEWVTTLGNMRTPNLVAVARANTLLAEAQLGLGYTNLASDAIANTMKIAEIDGLDRVRAEGLKGEILTQQKQWQEAEPLLVDSFNKLSNQLLRRKTHPWQRWQVSRACERVIAMYDAWGKSEEAAKWKAKLAEVNMEIIRLRNAGMADPPEERAKD